MVKKKDERVLNSVHGHTVQTTTRTRGARKNPHERDASGGDAAAFVGLRRGLRGPGDETNDETEGKIDSESVKGRLVTGAGGPQSTFPAMGEDGGGPGRTVPDNEGITGLLADRVGGGPVPPGSRSPDGRRDGLAPPVARLLGAEVPGTTPAVGSEETTARPSSPHPDGGTTLSGPRWEGPGVLVAQLVGYLAPTLSEEPQPKSGV